MENNSAKAGIIVVILTIAAIIAIWFIFGHTNILPNLMSVPFQSENVTSTITTVQPTQMAGNDSVTGVAPIGFPANVIMLGIAIFCFVILVIVVLPIIYRKINARKK
jgi:hypothetical protein